VEKVMHAFRQNIGWDTFLPIFSQTHVVALALAAQPL
jgi:hypothetical protein